MEQRTPEWFQARLGKVTASRIADVKRSYESSEDTDVSKSQTISGNNTNINPPLALCRIDTQPAGGSR